MKENDRPAPPEKSAGKNKLGVLFFTMLKIGLFTFGGGYAMISLLQNEFVTRKKWMDSDEFLDMAAIAESTPGPIAINVATYIGYTVGGSLGSLLATVAVCIPSFVIIYLISLFFDAFLALTPAANAFRGIQACVVYLILSAGLKMFRSAKKDLFSYIIMGVSALCILTVNLFDLPLSTVTVVLGAGAAGVILYLCRRTAAARKGGNAK